MSNPRARREQERRHRLAAEEARRQADRRARRNQRLVGIMGLAMIFALIAGLFLAAGRSGSSGNAGGTSVAPATAPSSLTSTTTADAGPPVSIPAVAPGATLTEATPCPPADGSAPRTTSFSAPPPMCVERGRDYIVTIATSNGDIKAMVTTDNAPAVVNNFVVLARYHYWDGVPISFIRNRAWLEVAPTFTNPPGVTSPGYTVASDAPPQAYTPLTLAMGVQPGTNQVGGTLVLGIGEQVVGLPQTTPVIGLILDGAEVLRQIGRAGTQSGQPTQVFTIRSVTVEPDNASATTSTTTR